MYGQITPQPQASPAVLFNPAFTGRRQPPPLRPVSFFESSAEIYRQGDIADRLYRVEQGAVRLTRILAEGTRQISAFVLKGEVFGFETGATRFANAEALGSTIIRSWNLRDDASELSEILGLAYAGASRAQRALFVLAQHSASARVAALLIDLAERQGSTGKINLPMPRSDIADHLGLTIETVSRVFSKLRSRQIVMLSGSRSVKILDWQALRQLGE